MEPITFGTAATAAAKTAFDVSQKDKEWRRSKKAAKKQFKYQGKLNKQAQRLGMKTWKQTNYGAQVEEMKKAGLSAGLMYGMSGAGGATTNTGSGGSAGQAHAPQAPSMDLQAINQSKLIESQINLNESQAEKNKAEAVKTSGVDTDKTKTEVSSLTQGINNMKTVNKLNQIETELKNLELGIQSEGKTYTLNRMKYESEKILGEAESALASGEIDQATRTEKKKIIKEELIAISLDNELRRQGIKKTKHEINSIAQSVLQKWEEIKIKSRGVSAQERANVIKTFEAELKGMYPSLWQEGGHLIENLWDLIEDMSGDEPFKRRTVPK